MKCQKLLLAVFLLIAAIAVPAPAQEKERGTSSPGGNAAGPQAAGTVTLESLLQEMIDRDGFARWPTPGYICKQASSYDRAQTDPANAKTWFANKDYEQFIRIEQNDGRREWVIMEHEGPGCVARMWVPLLAGKNNQTIRFYLDGAASPAIAVKFNDLMSGAAFVKPPLAFIAWDTDDLWHQKGFTPGAPRDVGGDCYLPIPFAKGCKITLDEPPFYYAITYRAYEPGTKVASFTMADFEAAKPVIERITAALAADAVPNGSPQRRQGEIPPGGELALDLPVGPATVRTLEVQLDPGEDPQTFRSTVITMKCDDEATIWCPLGEFFGCGVRGQPVRDWYRTVTKDGKLTCRWVMPYQKTARVALLNVSKQPVKATLAATCGPWTWDDRAMHFHANWRTQYPLPTRPMSDWNYVEIQGQSVYAGDTLTVLNPVRAWYGEGDERVYVDGEKFPSHLGTGTEDYYGYAWGMAHFFNSPFISMPRRESVGKDNWRGYTTTSRVRLLDGIPAKKSLKCDMEIWHWADCKVGYNVATFWYGRPGARSNIAPAPETAAAPVPAMQPTVRGAIECEGMRLLAKSPNLQIETQNAGLAEGEWSNQTQIFVRAEKPGNFVELLVAEGVKGPKRVTLYATKSYDYGVLRLAINGKVAAERWDGYSRRPIASGPIDLGVFEPQGGKIVLRVEVVDTNLKATGPKYYFGLDAVTLGAP